MVGYLKYSENSEDRELALQKPKKGNGWAAMAAMPPTPPSRGGPSDGPGWATTHTDGDASRSYDRSKNANFKRVKLQLWLSQLYSVRMLQHTLPAGFIAPWLPTKIDKLPLVFEWRPARTTEDRTCLRP